MNCLCRTLNNSLEKCKRKYEAKVKRLEHQLNDISLRSGAVSSLPSPNRSGSHRGGGGGEMVASTNNMNPMTSSVTMCKQRTHPQQQQQVPETTL